MSGGQAGKAARRARTAQLREAQLQAARRRRMLRAGGAITAVVAVVAALVIAKAAGLGGTSNATGPSSTRAAAGVVRDVTSVPATVLDRVGVGSTQAAPKRIDAPALRVDGKPRLLYVGAEYCPFCAAERWPVVVALSRFGTWSHLAATESAGNDVYPNTQTLSFHGASYSSRYLAFTGVETRSNKVEDGSFAPLDTPAPADQQVFEAYDRPPYTSGQAGGIPFLDVAGRYVSSGASYSPKVLEGKTRAEIAAALSDPGDPVAQAVDGSANVLTAAICAVTGGQPGPVCTARGVTAAAAELAKAQ